MKEANAPKYVQAEQESTERLHNRGKKDTEPSAREEKPAPSPESMPNDAPLDLPYGSPAPLSADEGIEIEDTSLRYDNPDAETAMEHDAEIEPPCHGFWGCCQ